jgi:hypothetical protein
MDSPNKLQFFDRVSARGVAQLPRWWSVSVLLLWNSWRLGKSYSIYHFAF